MQYMLKLKNNNDINTSSDNNKYEQFINFLKSINFHKLNKKYKSVTKFLNILMHIEFFSIGVSVFIFLLSLLYYVYFPSYSVFLTGSVMVGVISFLFICLFLSAKIHDNKVNSLDKYFLPEDLERYNEIVNYLHSKEGKEGLEALYKDDKSHNSIKMIIDNLIFSLNNKNHVDIMFNLKSLYEYLQFSNIITEKNEAEVFFEN